jgi:hypothetical protein
MMNALRALIQPYLVAHMGPGKPLTALADDLEKRMARNEVFLRYCIVLIAMLFVTTLALVFACRDQPKALAAVFAGSGIPLFGCITMMRDLWQQKGAIDVLLVTVRHLPAGEAKLALQKFLDTLTSKAHRSVVPHPRPARGPAEA